MKKEIRQTLKLSIILSISALVVFMDNAAMTISLPHIMQHFGVSQNLISLIPLSYNIGFMCTSLIFGKFCDAYGGKRVAIYAFSFLAVFSLLMILSTSFPQVVAIRFFQGICGAASLSAAIPIYSETLPQRHMGLGYSVSGIAMGVAIASGSIMQGHFLSEFSWKYIYFLELPLCLFSILTLYIFVPDRHVSTLKKIRFDIPAIIYSTGFIMFAVFSLNMGQEIGWFSYSFNLLITLSMLFLILFITNEKKTDNPMLNWKIFGIKGFGYTIAVKLFNNLCYIGVEFILPFFVIIALGERDVVAGYLNAFAAVSFAVSSILSALVIDKFSSCKVNTVFLGIRFAEYVLVLALLYFGVTIPSLVLIIVLIGLSGAFNVAATNKILTSYSTAEDEGSVSSVNTLFTSLSGTVSIVLVNLVYTLRMPPKGHLNRTYSFTGTEDVIEMLILMALIAFVLSFKAQEKTEYSKG